MGQCIRKELANQKKQSSKGQRKSIQENKNFDLNQFIQDSLNKHNELRKLHSVPELKINKELNRIAQKYAEYLASKDIFQHSKNKYHEENLGENLFLCEGMLLNGNMMTEEWYNEINDYNFNKPESTNNVGLCGHFTQVVWKDTKEVGFGGALSKKGRWYAVGNYYPAGNLLNDFGKNIIKI